MCFARHLCCARRAWLRCSVGHLGVQMLLTGCLVDLRGHRNCWRHSSVVPGWLLPFGLQDVPAHGALPAFAMYRNLRGGRGVKGIAGVGPMLLVWCSVPWLAGVAGRG